MGNRRAASASLLAGYAGLLVVYIESPTIECRVPPLGELTFGGPQATMCPHSPFRIPHSPFDYLCN